MKTRVVAEAARFLPRVTSGRRLVSNGDRPALFARRAYCWAEFRPAAAAGTPGVAKTNRPLARPPRRTEMSEKPRVAAL
jgi:hypothetical protein